MKTPQLKSNLGNCVCIIPSRHGSTRLPAKPLADIGGKPLVRHVWERAMEAGVFSRIIVATDHPSIVRAVRSFGGEAAMTPASCRSGTDRVASVARRVPAALVMNLQGDEPFMSPRALAALVGAMRKNRACPMGTVARRVPWSSIARNPNAVKVAVGRDGRAMYFSRSPIPFDWEGGGKVLQHLGVYLYRRDFLFRFARLPRTPSEKRERLEQLRALEYGIRPLVVTVTTPALSVDTPADLARARAWLRRGPKGR